MNDIGRFHAANMGLLKTIFEMNLQLFKDNSQELNRSKTLLLFIIRDYINTPIEKLKSTLLNDLDRLWKGITKPDQYNESQVITKLIFKGSELTVTFIYRLRTFLTLSFPGCLTKSLPQISL